MIFKSFSIKLKTNEIKNSFSVILLHVSALDICQKLSFWFAQINKDLMKSRVTVGGIEGLQVEFQIVDSTRSFHLRLLALLLYYTLFSDNTFYVIYFFISGQEQNVELISKGKRQYVDALLVPTQEYKLQFFCHISHAHQGIFPVRNSNLEFDVKNVKYL